MTVAFPEELKGLLTHAPTWSEHDRTVTEEKLRAAVVLVGLPDTCRSAAWKVFLGVRECDATRYRRLVEKRESEQYGQIRKDTVRTFKDKGTFLVPEEQLSRVLNAFVHAHQDCVYLQGLNVIAGVFLFVLPELEAFSCLEAFVLRHCPAYFHSRGLQPDGAIMRGCQLVHQCLMENDPEVYDKLQKAKIPPQFVLGSVMTFSADSKPIEQLIKIWDYMLATGPFMSTFIIAARIMLMRSDILTHHQLVTLLGKDLPPLPEAASVIALASNLALKANRKFFSAIVAHALRD